MVRWFELLCETFSRVLSVLNAKRPTGDCLAGHGNVTEQARHLLGALPTNDYEFVKDGRQQKSLFPTTFPCLCWRQYK